MKGKAALAVAAASLLAGTAFWGRAPADTALVADVRRGALIAQLTAGGILRPAQSITYRSPLGGREAEIIELVAEGTRVSDGDLLVRLDTTELRHELDRVRQEVRQADMDVQVADIERQEAEAAVKSIAEGEGALTVEETRTRLELMEKKADRLREEYGGLKPLLDKGFITREELKRTADALDEAEEELALARKRASVVTELAHPRDRQRAELQLAQKRSQLENARARAREAAARAKLLADQIENCSIHAKRPGLVVYEEFLAASPRRKIRVGDRVTASQGLVTIPDVNRMMVEASVSEAELHRVHPGQRAMVRVEAFPDLRLTGEVARVGTLARAVADRPLDDKRFDVVIALDPANADLRPEMTARADVIVGTRENVLLVPVNAVFEERGAFVCHVQERFGVDTRQVELGESNDRFVEILAGLREGEQVLLTAPAAGTASSAVTAGSARDRARRRGGRGDALQPR